MKKHLWKFFAFLTAVLSCIALCIIIYALSPLHPRNISDKAIIKNGTEFTVKLKGVLDCDENGFTPAADRFFLGKDEISVFVGEDGFAYTDYDSKSDIGLNGRYSSFYISYDNYLFCGETYKNEQGLQKFFDSPDMIYNFDINNLPNYIQDVMTYEKKFYGKATVKIYRKKCVITELYIGEEKVLSHKDIN